MGEDIDREAVLGIIDDSGLRDLPSLESIHEERIESQWAEDHHQPLRVERDRRAPDRSMSRHAQGHPLSPSDINYRANIDVMKRAGVTDLISLSACGSFKQGSSPGTFVLVDQFVDRTFNRASSFFGKGCVAHVSMAHPVAPPPSPSHQRRGSRRHSGGAGGTYVCIEGPQFSTLAESLTYKNLGYAVIGMTDLPEAKSARELSFARRRRHGHRLR